MKKSVKLVALVFAIAMTVASIPASAANYNDTRLEGIRAGYNWEDAGWTKYYSKETTTSIYFKTQSQFPLGLSVHGSNYSGGQNSENCTKGSYALIPAVTHTNDFAEYEIYNYVREYPFNHTFAALEITHNVASEPGYKDLYGCWSPDCAGHFTVANP